MWSLCAPMATYSPLSFGSLPGRMPTTLRAGSGTGATLNRTATATAAPGLPGMSWASGEPNSFAATALVIRNDGGHTLPPGPSSRKARGRRRRSRAVGRHLRREPGSQLVH